MLVIFYFFVFYIIIPNLHLIFVLSLQYIALIWLDGTDYVCLNI